MLQHVTKKYVDCMVKGQASTTMQEEYGGHNGDRQHQLK
jgi:hypothetical protein